MESHNFNEIEQRLEPNGNECIFCGRNGIDHFEDDYYTYLYREESRFNAVVYRKVKFKKIQIGATRCKECKQEHKKNSVYSFFMTLGVFLLITAGIAGVSYLLIDYLHPLVGIIAGLIMLVCNISYCCDRLYHKFHRKLAERKGIYSPHEGLKSYTLVRELISQGFKFNQPLA